MSDHHNLNGLIKPPYLLEALDAEIAAWKAYSLAIDRYQDSEHLPEEIIQVRRDLMNIAHTKWEHADRLMKASFQRWHDEGQAIPVTFTAIPQTVDSN